METNTARNCFRGQEPWNRREEFQEPHEFSPIAYALFHERIARALAINFFVSQQLKCSRKNHFAYDFMLRERSK